MAKTIEQWQQLIIDQLAANQITVSGSRTGVRRLWTFVFAFCAWTLDVLFDIHKSEVENVIAQLKPHTLRWYRNKAIAFQYGIPLLPDSDKYDNTGMSDEQLEESKIIKYAAVAEAQDQSRLIIKIATEADEKLQPLSHAQRNSFAYYISEIKDAGVKISIINYLPDRLYISMEIYYDPLILDGQGNSIIDGGRPVEKAVKQYMKELPFNGELIIAHLVDKLQKTPGVKIPHITGVQTCWIDGETGDYGAIQSVGVKKIPESGYFEVADFQNITYIPYA